MTSTPLNPPSRGEACVLASLVYYGALRGYRWMDAASGGAPSGLGAARRPDCVL
ncbi:MAG: hypothetical protein KGZ31_03760 [Sulfuritalea sp.]|nr:hypothetical protein [Sulfuritalea sp.]